jgi:uncharacterized repeat protein (TIGR03803 family)
MRSWHKPPPEPNAAGMVGETFSIRVSPLKIVESLLSHFALAGIGSLAVATLTPLPTVAAPGITLQGSFDGAINGSGPYAALTAAGNGIYYGTTQNGGANGNGAIFKFDSTTGSITLQDSFDGTNGSYPTAALTAAGNGLYYGTTEYGGTSNNGAIFEFDSANGSITLKGSFDGANGSNPYAALTAAGNGLYYGTTLQGGASNNGAIFEFDPANSANGSITLKGNFDGANGTRPYAALTSAGNGIYYGTTENGGGNGSGGIFEFDPANSANGSTTLKGNFNVANGSRPYAALAAAGNGIYYGTTYGGGTNFNGGIFAFDSANGSITLQGSFDFNNGSNPYAALTAAGNGIYYGTTYGGGANFNGGIFAFDSANGSINLLASFDGTNGSDPYGPYAALTAAGNGFFYGTTPNGGANYQGAIFAFDSGVRDPVPGPLPLMGAGAAFGWSRRLRRRIQQVRPVFPMGR